MEIISVTPRGYCQGVVRAIQMVRSVMAADPREPVSMLGMIVHNQYVVDSCRALGIHVLDDPGRTRLELLDEVESGIVIFTAHGVSDAVYAKAQAKGLKIVDATCPDVKRTHELVRAHTQSGDVLYIGKPHHPEAEGVLGLSPRVHLIAEEKDLASLGPLNTPMITCQTTLSLLFEKDLVEACRKAYPDAVYAPEICRATTIRQEAVLALQGQDVNLLIVVGDPRSNNSNQLKEIGKAAGIPRALLIENAMQLKEEQLQNCQKVAVTAGSSTPTQLTSQVLDVLHAYAEKGILAIPEKLPSIF
jgi:4-hydroxy-3-methylbut-2-enyl diphosphate reductase